MAKKKPEWDGINNKWEFMSYAIGRHWFKFIILLFMVFVLLTGFSIDFGCGKIDKEPLQLNSGDEIE